MDFGPIILGVIKMNDITKLKEEILKAIRKIDFIEIPTIVNEILSKYFINVAEIMPEFLIYGENKENGYKFVKIKFSLLQDEKRILWK